MKRTILFSLFTSCFILSFARPALSTETSNSGSSTDTAAAFIDALKVAPAQRPSQGIEKVDVKVVDYMWDGIGASRIDMDHPAIHMENSVPKQWQIRPSASSSSVSFANRNFASTSFSITFFKKGTYLKNTSPNSLKAVAAGLLLKYGSSIAFEPWQTEDFAEPKMPRAMVSYDAKSIGFKVTDTSRNPRVHRLYFFDIGDWIFEIAFEGDESNFKGTIEEFNDYLYNLSIQQR